MALLVDEAIWPWRGRRWAHLVSDSHLDELHELAHRIGLPYLSFQGDHYDVHEGLRDAAIVGGARPTPARDLVRALRGAGLRRRGPSEPWVWIERRLLEPGVGPSRLVDAVGGSTHRIGLPRQAVARFVDEAAAVVAPVEVALARRSGELIAVASSPVGSDVATGLAAVSPGVSVHRSVGERGTFVELLVRGER